MTEMLARAYGKDTTGDFREWMPHGYVLEEGNPYRLGAHI